MGISKISGGTEDDWLGGAEPLKLEQIGCTVDILLLPFWGDTDSINLSISSSFPSSSANKHIGISDGTSRMSTIKYLTHVHL